MVHFPHVWVGSQALGHRNPPGREGSSSCWALLLWAPWEWKKCLLIFLKYSPLVYFYAKYEQFIMRLGRVLGLSKRLMGYLMFMLWGLTKGFLTQKLHGTHHVFGRLRLGQFCGLYSWTVSVRNRRAETIKSYLWLSVTSAWWSFKILSLDFQYSPELESKSNKL